MDIMCLAFECEKKGVFKTGKHIWTIDEIAYAVGGDMEENKKCIGELLNLKILKKDKKNTIFQARIVRDAKLTKIRQDAGFKGGNPNLLKQTSKQNPTPSSSTSSSTSYNTDNAIGMEAAKASANDAWKDQAWRETICMASSITENELKKWMAQFNASVCNDSIEGFNSLKYKKLFRGFLNREIGKGVKVNVGVVEPATLAQRFKTINQ